jgi:hypothetical protein
MYSSPGASNAKPKTSKPTATFATEAGAKTFIPGFDIRLYYRLFKNSKLIQNF